MKIKKENLKLNKKNVGIAAAVLIAIICIGTAYGLSKSNSKTDASKKIENTAKKDTKVDKKKVKPSESKSNKDTADKKDSKSADKSNDDKVTDENKKTIKSESKASNSSAASGTTGTSNSGSSSVSQGSSSSSSSTVSSGSSASKPKRWVVDKDAWDETVQEAIYDYRPTWWIKFTDGSVKTFYDEIEWWNYKKGNVNAASWGNGQDEQYISGYTTKVIHHDEIGHWE